MKLNQKPVPQRLLEVRELPIDSLQPYKNNARVHKPRQIRQVAESMRTFGMVNPLLIDDDRTILAGHCRWESCKLLGMTSVPTICIAGLGEPECRALILADNRLAERSYFDKDKLTEELKFLTSVDFGFEAEVTGFDTVEIDKLLGYANEMEDGGEVRLPDPGMPAISRPGDLWIVGDHRIFCGNARLAKSYELLLGTSRAAMIFTDPPYNVRITNNVSGRGAKVHGEFLEASGELSASEFTEDFLRPSFRNIAAFAEPGAIAYICMDWRHVRELMDAATGVFARQKNLIVWVKSHGSLGAFYRSQHELIFAYQVSEGPVRNNFGLGGGGRNRTNCWHYPGVNTFGAGRKAELESHPTVKPANMVADAMLDCSKPGDIILDPFLGSGTLCVAAARTGRRGYGIELDPQYVDVCVERTMKETRLQARLETGETFAERRAQRDAALQEGE